MAGQRDGRRRGIKVLRVLGGIVLMVAFVGVALLLVWQRAGAWGVPYFSFTSEHGSPCRNNLTGYTCHPTTLGDVEFFGEVNLPADTRVVDGTYHSTHDYQLNATLEVPARSSAAALKGLNEAFGRCQRDHVSPLDARGLTQICVLANDDAITDSKEETSRLYVIGTGVRKNGVRVIALAIKSR